MQRGRSNTRAPIGLFPPFSPCTVEVADHHELIAAAPPRSPIAWLLVPLVTGYILAPGLPTAPILLAIIGTVFAALALAAAFAQHLRISRAATPFLAFAAASLLAGAYLQHRTAPPPGWDSLPPREAALGLEVHRLFGSASTDDRLHGFAKITEAEPHLSDLAGQLIYFSMYPVEPGGPRWSRGTRLRTIGVLERLTPEATEQNGFLAYLAQSGAHFQYRRASLRDPALPSRGFFGFCARQHDRIEDFLRRGETDRAESFVNVYIAMLLGKRAELGEAQKAAFLQTGTLHLFAISGLHIGVIAFALHTFLTLLRLPTKPAALIGLTLLLCFVGITGAAPSAVRAFLMVFFFWSARFFGRAPNPVAALANSAIFVLLLFPHQLWSAGFQLSYAVVAGILFLGLPLGQHLQEKWAPFSGLPPDSLNRFQGLVAGAARQVSTMLAVSLSATLLSAPLSIHYFGLFTPGAILLNLLMIPAAGLVIVAGFIAVALSFFGLGVVGILFNHAAWLVIAAMETLVGTIPAVPFLFWQAAFVFPWQGPAILVVLLGGVLICAHRQWQAPCFHFATPFLLFVLCLLAAGRLTFLVH